MKKVIIYSILIFTMLSCGGNKDISVKYNGNYIAVDKNDNALFYGINIKKNRVFELWYLNKKGIIEKKQIELQALEIENFFRYNYSTNELPTWVYEYSGEDIPIRIIFSEYRNGDVIPSIFFTNKKVNYIIPMVTTDVKDDLFIGAVDQFLSNAKLIKVTKDITFPILQNINETDFYKSQENRHLKFKQITNRYFIFEGNIIDNDFTGEQIHLIKITKQIFLKYQKSLENSPSIDQRVRVIGKVIKYNFDEKDKSIIILTTKK